MKKMLALAATVAAISTQALAWDCPNYYSNIKAFPGVDDMSGYEVYVNPEDPRRIDLILLEGSVLLTPAKKVQVVGNRMTFQAYDQAWTLTCTRKGVVLDGNMTTSQFLRPGSFVVRNRIHPTLID